MDEGVGQAIINCLRRFMRRKLVSNWITISRFVVFANSDNAGDKVVKTWRVVHSAALLSRVTHLLQAQQRGIDRRDFKNLSFVTLRDKTVWKIIASLCLGPVNCLG